jgi:hypothetical protein
VFLLASKIPARAAALPLETSEGAGNPLQLADFQPRSMPHVPETKVARSRYPVIDIYTHLPFAAKSANGVGIGDAMKYLTTAEAALPLMDRLTIRDLILCGRHVARWVCRSQFTFRIPKRSSCPSTVSSVDIFLPNQQEACKLTGARDVESALESLSRLVSIVVTKCGAPGAVAKHGAKRFSVPALLLQFFDTVGAGDSFNAGFLDKFIRGSALQDCLEYGVACAGLSTTRTGGTEAFRDHQHRESFL